MIKEAGRQGLSGREYFVNNAIVINTDVGTAGGLTVEILSLVWTNTNGNPSGLANGAHVYVCRLGVGNIGLNESASR